MVDQRVRNTIFAISLLLSTALSAQAKSTTVEYKVAPGDSLSMIAKKFDTTTKTLCKLNSIKPNAPIKKGQILKLPKPKPLEYTVKSGDTLYTVAHSHNITIKELAKTNSFDLDTKLKIGQKIKVPAAIEGATKSKKPSANHSPKKEYIVQSGDTLFSIARKNKVSIKELMSLNGIGSTDIIKTGQVLKLPKSGRLKVAKPKTKTKPSYYIVKKGDTLYKIAKKHNLKLKEIRAINKMSKKKRIRTGMVLAVSKDVKVVHYRVKRKDTLKKIAKKYKLSPKDIMAQNRLKSATILKRGKRLTLVVKKSKTILAVLSDKKRKKVIYRVKKGDTLWIIAHKNSTTIQEIRKLNKLKRGAKIYKGMKLVLTAPINKKAKKSKANIKNVVVAKTKKRKKSRINSALAVLSTRGGRSYGSASKVIRTAKRYLGRRYVWGAEGPNKFDCSGFTQYVMRKSRGVRLPRISRRQAYYGKYVSRRNLRPGDLVFFDTSRRRRGYVNHVGIYIGNNKFIHASSARHRVVITSLNRPFYRSRFKWGRRI